VRFGTSCRSIPSSENSVSLSQKYPIVRLGIGSRSTRSRACSLGQVIVYRMVLVLCLIVVLCSVEAARRRDSSAATSLSDSYA
jgi:hypothetical protein